MFTPIKMLVLVVSHSSICMKARGKEFTAHPYVLVVREPIWCLNRVTTIADALHVKLWGTWVKNTSMYVQSMEQNSLPQYSEYWWGEAQNSGWVLRLLCSLRLEQIHPYCRWIIHETLRYRSERHSIICRKHGIKRIYSKGLIINE